MAKQMLDRLSMTRQLKNKKGENLFQKSDPDKLYDVVDVCGKGTYGIVYKAIHRTTKKTWALKVMNLEDLDDDDIINELQIMKRIQHPNVVSMDDAYLQKRKITMAIDFCEGGSVLDIREELAQPFPEMLIRYVFREVLVGLKYLHSLGIVHRDVKCGNILFNDEGGVKLADFGVSSQGIAGAFKLKTFIGSPYWMAPEVIVCDETPTASYNEKCDIWSTGITVIECIDGLPPLIEIHPMRALQYIVVKEPPTITCTPEKWSDRLHEFVASCLQKSYHTRCNAAEMLDHPFVSELQPEEFLRDEVMYYVNMARRKMAGEDIDVEKLLDRRTKQQNHLSRQINIRSTISEDSFSSVTDISDTKRYSSMRPAIENSNLPTMTQTAAWLRAAIHNRDEEILRYACCIANLTNYRGAELEEANEMFKAVSECRKACDDAYKSMTSRKHMDISLCAADKLSITSDSIEGIRRLLHHTPVDKFLQIQLKKAQAAGDKQRIAEITIEIKDKFYEMFGTRMFQLCEYGFLRSAKSFAKSYGRIHNGKKEDLQKGMLEYQKGPIPTSLLRLEPKLEKIATGNFKRLQRFMSDKPREEVIRDGQYIIDGAMNNIGLRDEVYCQVMKQLTKNFDGESRRKGWQFMQACVQCFPPSDDFANFVEIFLRENAEPTNNFEKEDFIAHLHKTTFTSGSPFVNMAVILTRSRQVIEEPQKISDVPLESNKTAPTPIAQIALPGQPKWNVVNQESGINNAGLVGEGGGV
eukprot:CFRG8408T1